MSERVWRVLHYQPCCTQAPTHLPQAGKLSRNSTFTVFLDIPEWNFVRIILLQLVSFLPSFFSGDGVGDKSTFLPVSRRSTLRDTGLSPRLL